MKRLFILGCPRSGTSWTRALLGEHPAVAAAHETPVFYGYLRPWHERWMAEKGAPDDDVLLRGFLDDEAFYGLCRATAQAVLDAIAARRPGAEVVVDKTPNNTLDWALISRLFPDAYFLHVVRDPRDTVCSIRAAAGSFGSSWAPRRALPAARFWRRYVEAGRAVRGATARWREVRYEDLVERGVEELARLHAWIGVDPMPGPALAAHPPARRGDWRRGLTGDDARAVEQVAGELMEALGYEREFRTGTWPPVALVADGVRRRARSVARAAAGRVRGWLDG